MATRPLKEDYMRTWLEGVPINANSTFTLVERSQVILNSVCGCPSWLYHTSSLEYPPIDISTEAAIAELAESVAFEGKSLITMCNWTLFEEECFKKVLPVFLATVVALRQMEKNPKPTSQKQWKMTVLAFITAVLDCSKDPMIETANHQTTYQFDQKICMPWSFNATAKLTDLFASTTAEFTVSTVTCAFNALSDQLPDDPGLTFLSWMAEPDRTANAFNVLQCAIEFASSDRETPDPSLRITTILALAQGQHRALKLPQDYIFGMTIHSGTVTVYASTEKVRRAYIGGFRPLVIAPVETLDMKKPRDLLRFFCVLLSIRRHFLSAASRIRFMRDAKFPEIITDFKMKYSWKTVASDFMDPVVWKFLNETVDSIDNSSESARMEPEGEVLKFLNETVSFVEDSLSSNIAARRDIRRKT